MESSALLSALAAGIWLLLPAGAANMAPVLAARAFPSWDLPVDFGWSPGGKRLFGAHKTWRGMAAGVIAGGLVFVLQQHVADLSPAIQGLLADLDHGRLPLLFGAWLGLGALVGDLVKSFAKRRLGIAPGRSWFPFDQLDWLFGALAFASPFLRLSGGLMAAVLLLGLVLHLAIHALGRAMGLNRSWI